MTIFFSCSTDIFLLLIFCVVWSIVNIRKCPRKYVYVWAPCKYPVCLCFPNKEMLIHLKKLIKKKNDYIYWGMHYFDSLLEIWRRLSLFIFSLSTAFVIENFCWKRAGLLDTQLWWGCMDSLRSLNTEFSKLLFFFVGMCFLRYQWFVH